ncbi:velvet factor-domain-containing protein [Boletus edulis BED1]|uniref:Velvet factor-domain-containing protein n=1 Tax=Boletus edulis BED1 TaxID=1328754 RepID=A0AAD4BFQ4_BOLED|nr:velvet factor-domain-containing protein [Boletus edulis BED1]
MTETDCMCLSSRLFPSSYPTSPTHLFSYIIIPLSRLMFNHHREYDLTVRQEPKQARMCGVGPDRRPIDPPPIIQLRVIDPHTRQPPSPANQDAEDADPNYAHSFLQNPYYFMFASLAKPDDDTELHWLKDGKTRCTTGSVVSSLYHLKDSENRNEDAGFFVFPDLSVRTEGSYRLKLSLFEVVSNTVRHCKSIYSAAFYVYTAKKFPGMEESTPLSCSLADQGIKIRIRKDIRVRKRPIAALAPPSDGGHSNAGESRKVDQDQNEDDAHPQQSHMPLSSQPGSAVVKRARHGTLTSPLHHVSGPASVASSDGMSAHTPVLATNTPGSSIALAGLPAWPTSSLDPMLGVASATPGGIELSTTSTLSTSHPPPHTHAHQAMGVGIGVGGQLLSAGSEPSSSGSASAAGAGAVPRRTGAQPSTSPYPSSSSTVGGMINYDYEPAGLRNTTSSYDPQRPLGSGVGTGYENASGESGRGGYDASGARSGYENAAGGGRASFDHVHQHHPRGSYDPRAGYESSQAPSRAPYNTHPHTHNQPHAEVHGHPSRASFTAPYESAQAYQDGQQHPHHGGYAHPQQTSAGYAHASSTGSHPHHPPASHHPQQGQYPSPTRSQYPTAAYSGSYVRYDVGANTNPNENPNANGPGGSGGYYDNSSSSPSPHPHSAYYASGTSGQAQAQSSQVAPAPPLTHTASFASSGSGGSPYEYGGQGQGHGSSPSGEYYSQAHGHGHVHGHPSRMVSPAPNARYSGPSYASGAQSASASMSGWGPNGGGHAHGLGQQEMIHLAPLRHGSGGGGASTGSSSSSPSSPALPSVSGYPVIQLSRAPFEQDGRGVGVPGKKSVLSIGSIISDGV